MLSREVMGVLALAILWVNALLVVGAAGKELGRVLRLLRRLRPLSGTGEGLVEGHVESGGADGGALAVHRLEQLGRYAADDGDRRAIAFADRDYRSEVAGGVLHTSAGPVRVEPTAAGEVWPERAAQLEGARCRSAAEFDRAYGDARKARGFARAVVTALGAGSRVWALGALRRDDDGALRLDPAGDGTLLVSASDPRRFCRRAAALLVAFMIGALAAAALCTALALYPPVFGTVSTVGGALGLAYFLLVQPAGTAVRDLVRAPSQAIVRGSWVEGTVDSAAREAKQAA